MSLEVIENVRRSEVNQTLAGVTTSEDAVYAMLGDDDDYIIRGLPMRTRHRVLAMARNNPSLRVALAKATQLREQSRKVECRESNHVYFIQAATTCLIKIGTSVDPKNRLSTLQTGSPDRLELIGIMDGNQKLERELHAKFQDCRMHGEWFDPSPTMLTYIEENAR